MVESLKIEPDNSAIGALLQAEREKQKLTRKQVSEKLNLSESMISALENDQDVHEIPQTYIRGYRRAYVRLLGIKESEVLDDLSHAGAVDKPQHDFHYFDKNVANLTKTRRNSRKLTKIAAFLAIAAAIYFSWPNLSSFLSLNDDDRPAQNLSQTGQDNSKGRSDSGQKVVILNAANVSSDDGNDADVSESADNLPEEDTQGGNGALAERGISTEIIDLANKLDQTEQLDSDDRETELDLNASENQIETRIAELLVPQQASPSESDLQAPVDQPTAATSVNHQETQATITFVSNGESWLSIEDAQKNKLYRNILKLDRVTVTGDLPLYVSTGNVGVLRVLANRGEQQKIGIFNESRTVAKFFVDLDPDGQLKFTAK